VHYILRGDRYWSNVLDEVESHIVENRLTSDGVTIHYNTNLVEIFGKKDRLTGIRAKTGDKFENINCHILGIAIGIRPRKELAAVAHLNSDRGILVDPYLRTSHPDVFSAGDVAQVYDPYTCEYTLDSLWGPAIEMGHAAGLNMSGCTVLYQKLIPFNVTRLAGLITTIIGQVGSEVRRSKNADQDTRGIMRGESEAWRLIPDASTAQTYTGDNRLRLYMNCEQIVGAVIMGDQKISYMLQHLIRRQVDIGGLRSRLLEPGAALADIIQTFWQQEGLSYAAKIP
jgi:NAD(P)H-nitrite reductase large subunit